MSEAIRILIAEDHAVVREGLQMLIEAQADMTVVESVGNGREAVEQARTLKPDIVLMDVSMPELNGLLATAKLKRVAPEIKVLALTRHTDEAYLRELFEAGANGYALKQSPARELLRALRVVAAGHSYLDPAMTGKVFDFYVGHKSIKARGEVRGAPLTEREREVLRHIALGFSNKEIAEKMDISVKTIETHKAHAQQKLNITGRNEIVRYAILQSWLQHEE